MKTLLSLMSIFLTGFLVLIMVAGAVAEQAVTPEYDLRIEPEECSLLTVELGRKTIAKIPCGHIGAMTKEEWRKISIFLSLAGGLNLTEDLLEKFSLMYLPERYIIK